MITARPLKVMYLIDYYFGTGGGTERQLRELIHNLDYEQCTPFMTVLSPTSYLGKHDFPCEVNVLGIRSLSKMDTLLKLMQFAFRLRALSIDVVHIFFNDAAMAAPLFCRLGGARVVSSRRDMGFWYTPTKLSALSFSNLFVDAMVANCEAVRVNASKKEGFPEDKIRVIYNGHDMERFRQLPAEGLRASMNIGENGPIIGMVGNLYEIKRPEDLLAAFRIVLEKRPDAHLVFVGGGEREIRRVQAQAASMNLERQIHFLGKVDNPVPYVLHFDVCVLCSESEGLSNAIIEYMGCGKATVCTDAGGNIELIRDGHNGFVIPVGAREALAERILLLIEDRDMRSRFEMNARAVSMEERFTISSLVQSHYELYQELARNGRI